MSTDNAGKDPVEVADQFWKPVNRLLANLPAVGFVNSRPCLWNPGQTVSFTEQNDGLAFTRLQYALAPSVLMPHPSQPWIVARFDTRQELLQFVTDNNYHILLSLSPGMALTKNRDSR